ncbi:MAG: hypothetical protein MR662_09200 [Treponema porcinum]|uniref:hypothetical protein n=1 Tax=Treponema porcinum TaxID=261392 RepID=UPI002357157E|nr:hypothetical protein [Treponema porcinum]MCI6180651.1 hypothetical protein [Treponema porcinum]MCI6983844.1 hypothetical protein [Treponema porcinum]MCI7534551.1 hypothetical protein [Treponema porcinum]MCI7545359.1 hypothetical protein [Treponema porcinum]MDY4190094.1 hypothetical protein [Treponema porcinum]
MEKPGVFIYSGIEKKSVYKRTILGTQGSMPPADIAVRLAKALNVTVEYLVTGEQKDNLSMQNSIKPKIERDLESCSDETQNFLSTAVHLFVEYEKNQKK